MASVFDFVYSSQPKIPTTRALILTGLQNDFCSLDGKLFANIDNAFIQRLEEVVTAFRGHGFIIWIRSEFDPALPPDQHGVDASNTCVPPVTRSNEEQPGSITSQRALSEDEEQPESMMTVNRQRSPSDHNLNPSTALRDEELFLDANARGGPATIKNTAGSMYFDKIKHLIKPEDQHIIKHNYSAFESTSLLHSLRIKLVSHVFICGALTNVSAYATASDAASNGIQVTFIEDCLAYRFRTRHDLAIQILKRDFVAKPRTSQQVLEALQNPLLLSTINDDDDEEDDVKDDEDEEFDYEDGYSDVTDSENGDRHDQLHSVGDICSEQAVRRSKDAYLSYKYSLGDRHLPSTATPLNQRYIRPEDLEVDSNDEEEDIPLQITLPMRALSKEARHTSSQGATFRQENRRNLATACSKLHATVLQSVQARPGRSDGTSLTGEGSKSDETAGTQSTAADPPSARTGADEQIVINQVENETITKHTPPILVPTINSACIGHQRNDNEPHQPRQDMLQASSKPDDSSTDRQLKTQQSWQSLFHSDDDSQTSLVSSERLLLADVEGLIPGFRSKMQKPLTEVGTAHGQKDENKHLKQHLFSPEDPQASAGSSIVYHLLDDQAVTDVFDDLKAEVQWVRMLHQTGEVPRLVCCQGTFNQDGSMPVYRHPADKTILISPWTRRVDEIRKVAESVVGHELNHALIQLYRTGHDFISEHSDKTLDILPGSNIVNVSFGAERTMRLRTKRGSNVADRTTHRIPMPHNSMLIMSLATNAEYLHGIKADKRREAELSEAESAFSGQRISITFRQIGTFLSADSEKIWGQGAIAKTTDQARPVINGDEVQSKRLIDAFGRENQSSVLDWSAWYDSGSDVLHVR